MIRPFMLQRLGVVLQAFASQTTSGHMIRDIMKSDNCKTWLDHKILGGSEYFSLEFPGVDDVTVSMIEEKLADPENDFYVCAHADRFYHPDHQPGRCFCVGARGVTVHVYRLKRDAV